MCKIEKAAIPKRPKYPRANIFIKITNDKASNNELADFLLLDFERVRYYLVPFQMMDYLKRAHTSNGKLLM